MYIATTADPVLAIRAKARREAGRPSLPVLMRRWLENASAQRLDRQVEQAVVRLEHAGVLDEMRQARRRG